MRLFIGSSASECIDSKYYDDCKKFLYELFNSDHDLVFGASDSGIMGLSYEGAVNNERDILGIYPSVYRGSAKNLECRKIETTTINERTEMIIKNSDVLIFLPGGFGTVYELFTSLECRRAYEFAKPIIIYNSCGYFDKLFEFLELIYDEGFASRKIMDYYYICNDVRDCLDYIDRYYKIENRVKKKIKNVD